jgi:aldehyde dehydrogenase
MSNQVARPQFKSHYDNYIGGKFVAPVNGQYFENPSPIDGKPFTKAARSDAADIERALDAAHEAFKTWKKTSVTERSNMLLRIADRIEQNLEKLAVVETIDNGKPIRETRAADLPLVVDHFRYFAGVIRAEEGTVAEIDENTVSMCIHEPLGVVGQIIPWNFPLLMAAWKVELSFFLIFLRRFLLFFCLLYFLPYRLLLL